MLSNLLPSSSSPLSATQAIQAANIYLGNARESSDVSLALFFCDNTEIPLSQAKTAFKKARHPQTPEDHALRDKLVAVYVERGKLLEQLGHPEKAQASFEKAKKWGYIPQSSSSTQSPLGSVRSVFLTPGTALAMPSSSPSLKQGNVNQDVASLSLSIFPKNLPSPMIRHPLPKPDDRLSSISQLAYCLALLSESLSSDPLSVEEQTWQEATKKNAYEKDRLQTLATDVIRAFIQDKLKDKTIVSEVLALAASLDSSLFRKLLTQLVDEIDKTRLLDLDLLAGLAQLIPHPPSADDVKADDLVKILDLLNSRLQQTHIQSTDNIHQLTLTVSRVLDAMADSQVTGLSREDLHEPLGVYLKALQSSDDPYVVYQAAYAYQALQYVPDDETPWQAAMRRTSKVFEGVFGLASAVKGLNLNEFIEGLNKIQEGFAGATDIIKTVAEAYEGVTSLAQSGQSFLDSLKEGFSFERKKAWYSALRGLDILVQQGQLAEFRQLVCAAPCRRELAFQWGVIEHLGRLAADPKWDESTRYQALDFLGELYQNDVVWGSQPSIKQWIIQILRQLAVSDQAAQTMLATLKEVGPADKQALYQTSVEEALSLYPVNIAPPSSTSSVLLNRVQNKLDVETNLRKLNRRRLQAKSDEVYIAPQGKPSSQASEETWFDLTEKVKDFLADDKKEVFLLLGDSGAGKSTFNRSLEADLWQTYKEGGRIPLFIPLAAIDKPEHDFIAKHLHKEGFSEPQIKELKIYRKFIVICDGYDESQQTHNLHTSNRLNQSGEWQTQMVISCRSEYLEVDYRDRFQPINQDHKANTALFEEAVIAPFSESQINDYVSRYIEKHTPLWQAKDYQQALEDVPHLKELVRNPFLLTLALEVLPSLVDPRQDLSSVCITRVALYDQFVEQWLERGKKRLRKKDLSRSEKQIFEWLSKEGFSRNGLAFFMKLASAIYERQAGNPVVEYTRLVDQKTWKEEFFGWEDEKQFLLAANPLTSNGNQYRFLHKSLLEYGVARAIFEPQLGGKEDAASTSVLTRRGSVDSVLSFESQHAADELALAVEQPLLETLLARKYLIGEPSILQFLVERAKQEPLFMAQLHAVIHRSKTDFSTKVLKAAANAITILIKAGVQFNGIDLTGIRIPRADLSYGLLDSAQLRGADLRKVNLTGVWLRDADLRGARMEGVQLGELPGLQLEEEVSACSYSSDGRLLAVAYGDIVALYETFTLKEKKLLIGHKDKVYSVAISADSQYVVSGSWDNTIRVWDWQKPDVEPRVLRGHTREVLSVSMSVDGRYVVSGGQDNTVRVWDLQTSEAVHSVLSGHKDPVYSVSISADGQYVVSGSDDKTVKVWNWQTPDVVPHVLKGHERSVNSVAISVDGRYVVSGSRDNTVRVWDWQMPNVEPRILRGHISSVNSVVISAKSRYVASGSEDKTVRVWDWQTPDAVPHVLSGHGDSVESISMSADGRYVVSGSVDATVRVWNWQTPNVAMPHALIGHESSVNSSMMSADGRYVVSGSDDRTVKVWNWQTPDVVPHVLKGHERSVNSVAISADGRYVASGSWDNTIRVLDWQTQDAVPCVLSGHLKSVSSVVMSLDGRYVVSGSFDNTLRIWDWQMPDAAPRILSGHEGFVKSVAMSSDGQYVVSGGNDRKVKVWEWQTSEVALCVLDGHEGFVESVAMSPDGRYVVAGSQDNTVYVWDWRNLEAEPRLLNEHEGWVDSIAISADSKYVASGSWDKTVRVWDIASGHCLATIYGFNGDVKSVAWQNIDGLDYLITGSSEGAVRCWQLIPADDQWQVRLRWASSQDALTLVGAKINGDEGLSPMNNRLFEQHCATGEWRKALEEKSLPLMTKREGELISTVQKDIDIRSKLAHLDLA